MIAYPGHITFMHAKGKHIAYHAPVADPMLSERNIHRDQSIAV